MLHHILQLDHLSGWAIQHEAASEPAEGKTPDKRCLPEELVPVPKLPVIRLIRIWQGTAHGLGRSTVD
jgi:hypothetical protein